jgi:hypothetical protein
LFAPAGFTFAIWGVIYILLAVFIKRSFGVVSAKKPQLSVSVHDTVVRWFTLSSVLNVLWLFAWQYKVLWLSVILMLGLLVTLLKIVYLLAGQKLSSRENYLVRTPFMVYAGWISVATIANITTWLVSIGWNQFGLSGDAWMVTVLFIGLVIGALAGVRLMSVAFVAVFVWAYFGILQKHITVFNAEHMGVIAVLSICIAVLVSVAIMLSGRVPGLERKK